MTLVRTKDGEPLDNVVRRFKRAVEKSGVLSEVRKREFHQPPSKVKQRKIAAAIKRARKKQARENSEFKTSGHGGRRGTNHDAES